MKFSVPKFNSLLHNLGQAITWRAAHDCPCRNPDSGAAAYDCTVCSGIGTYWDDEIAAHTALASQKVHREWANMGLWESGDVVLTIPSDTPVYDIGEFDRVVFIQSTQPFSLTRTRTGGEVLDIHVATVTSVAWLDSGGNLVQGGVPTVAAGGALSWDSGEPPAGVQYSITGRQRPEYFCYGEFPQDRAHHGGMTLPRRVVLRRFDLFGRQAA